MIMVIHSSDGAHLPRLERTVLLVFLFLSFTVFCFGADSEVPVALTTGGAAGGMSGTARGTAGAATGIAPNETRSVESAFASMEEPAPGRTRSVLLSCCTWTSPLTSRSMLLIVVATPGVWWASA